VDVLGSFVDIQGSFVDIALRQVQAFGVELIDIYRFFLAYKSI